MKKKVRVALLYGGKSAEHEISIISARNIFRAINKEKYEIVAVAIDRQGRWFLDQGARLLRDPTASAVTPARAENAAAVIPGETSTPLLRPSSRQAIGAVDVVFPVLHGPFGEDGTIQGLLKLAGVPFVGAGVLASALGMDKDVSKRLFLAAGVPTPEWLMAPVAAEAVEERLGYPVIVKPNGQGST